VEVLYRLYRLASLRVSPKTLTHRPICPAIWSRHSRSALTDRFVYLYFTVIETKGRHGSALPLEEVSRLFDGDDAEVDLLDEGVVPGLGDEKRRASDGTLLGADSGPDKKASGAHGEIEQVEAVNQSPRL
jgi:hypothetical protein